MAKWVNPWRKSLLCKQENWPGMVVYVCFLSTGARDRQILSSVTNQPSQNTEYLTQWESISQDSKLESRRGRHLTSPCSGLPTHVHRYMSPQSHACTTSPHTTHTSSSTQWSGRRGEGRREEGKSYTFWVRKPTGLARKICKQLQRERVFWVPSICLTKG